MARSPRCSDETAAQNAYEISELGGFVDHEFMAERGEQSWDPVESFGLQVDTQPARVELLDRRKSSW